MSSTVQELQNEVQNEQPNLASNSPSTSPGETNSEPGMIDSLPVSRAQLAIGIVIIAAITIWWLRTRGKSGHSPTSTGQNESSDSGDEESLNPDDVFVDVETEDGDTISVPADPDNPLDKDSAIVGSGIFDSDEQGDAE